MTDSRAHAFGRNAQAREELCSEALLIVDDREEEILGHDGFVGAWLVDQLKNLFGLRAERDLAW
jgi:hypothetical protein